MTDDPPEKKPPPKLKYIPKARVFIIGEEGNNEYEKLLEQGANGEVVLGRKEVTDIRGSLAYKVYQEWIVTVKPKQKKAKKKSSRNTEK